LAAMLTQTVLKRQPENKLCWSDERIMDGTPSLNLRVVTRHNHNITYVVDKSSYCVLYTISTASSSWTKAGYEGTLFIYT
jgi:Dcp1-like decapping family